MFTTVFTPVRDGDWVELAARRRDAKGRLFEKHFLSIGDLIHPETGEKVKIDKSFVRSLVKNFNDGVCPIVQVPLADSQNRHTEDPSRNVGEVVGISERGGKLYATVDVRDENAAAKIGETLIGASAFLHLNYTDTSTGKRVGPTLMHLCITNRPYVADLEDFQEIIAATADMGSETVMLTEGHVDKDALIAELKDKHGIDVAALQQQANKDTGVNAEKLTADLTAALTAALKPAGDKLNLSAGNDSTISLSDIVEAVGDVASQNVKLSDQIVKLTRNEAEREVADKVKLGYILPEQQKDMVELRLTNPDMYGRLVPAKPIVAMNSENGVDGNKSTSSHQVADRDAEVARLSALISTSGK